MAKFIAKDLINKNLNGIATEGLYAKAQWFFDERINYIKALLEFCNYDLNVEVETTEVYEFYKNKFGSLK